MDIKLILQDIFREVLDDESINITINMSYNDLNGWDSLAQVRIINACETFFNIKFSLDEIVNFKNIGNIIDTIVLRTNI